MKYTLFSLLLFASSLLYAQPTIQWQKCFGGTKNDVFGGMTQTRDGGYIAAWSSVSSDGDLRANHGGYDMWIVKMNADWKIQWQKTYGGSNDDFGGAIIQTFDGGYLICGSTSSSDGDVTGLHSKDIKDIWLVKIDSNGNLLSQKTLGGSKTDDVVSMLRTGEGEYLIAGITQSNDGDVKGFHGGSGSDFWVMSITESGTIKWQKTFGGTGDDYLYDIFQTSDRGFALTGYTYSTDGDISSNHGSSDVWLLKISQKGDIEWQKTYGGSADDQGYAVIRTLDHGYAIAGNTTSNNGDVSGLHGSYFADAWIVKLDSTGKTEWQKCLGGSNGDAATSIVQTADSGYVVSGNTASSDGDVTGYHGNSDCWVLKLSKSGKLLWQKTLGGSANDANIGSGIMQTADSGFLVVTVTSSSDGDVSDRRGDSTRDGDIWLVKLAPEKQDVQNISNIDNWKILLYPNPSTGIEKISYVLDKPSQVKIEIFNPLGENLRTLLNTKEEAGSHEHTFDISMLPSGSYFLRVELEGKIQSKEFELLK